MRLRGSIVVTFLVAGLTAAAEQPVRVYTNADIEKLPPIPTSEPPPATEEPGWDFVIDFLAEQHARIDAQRAFELEHARIRAADREPERPRYALPLNYWYWPACRGAGCGQGPEARPAPAARPGDPRSLVVPLHARRPLR